ncbi:MAG: hypothetical protein RIQ81_710, partial [Pseudomonadota bacterium]
GSGPASGSGSGPASGSGSGPASGSGSGPASGSGSGPASGNQLASYGLEAGDPTKAQFSEVASAAVAQGYVALGEAASYNGAASDASISGVHTIKIPLAETSAARQPALIVFDSCTMADNVAASLIANNSSGLNDQAYALTSSGDQAVLTFFNQNPLYYFAINYRLLTGLQYRGLPFVLFWNRDAGGASASLATPSVKAAATAIEQGLASVGLDRNRVIEHHIDPNPEERKKLKPEFLRLNLSVQSLRMDNIPGN